MQSIITILGTTAIGKSKLSIELAKKFDGIIISADSRQIYKGFDIGSGKITADEMQGIEHYMLDIKELWQDYNLSEFKTDATAILSDLKQQNTLPFIVGGTGLYIESIIYDYQIPNIPPQAELRHNLSQKTKEILQKILLEIKPAHNLNQSDWHNPVRLIRAIETANINQSDQIKQNNSLYNSLIIGLKSTLENIKSRITKRVDDRLTQGTIEEVQKIQRILGEHLSPEMASKKICQFGLGTNFILDYLNHKIDYRTMREKYIQAEYQYARRQLTWFRRMKDIVWFEADDKDLINKTSILIADFLK